MKGSHELNKPTEQDDIAVLEHTISVQKRELDGCVSMLNLHKTLQQCLSKAKKIIDLIVTIQCIKDKKNPSAIQKSLDNLLKAVQSDERIEGLSKGIENKIWNVKKFITEEGFHQAKKCLEMIIYRLKSITSTINEDLGKTQYRKNALRLSIAKNKEQLKHLLDKIKDEAVPQLSLYKRAVVDNIHEMFPPLPIPNSNQDDNKDSDNEKDWVLVNNDDDKIGNDELKEQKNDGGWLVL